MSQVNTLHLQALMNVQVKNYVADTIKRDNQVATHLLALTVKSANSSGPLLNAREVVARHLKRKVQEITDSSGQAELAQAQDLQAERLRKLSRELVWVGKDQLIDLVDDARSAKKLCRLLGLPNQTLVEWERSRRAKRKQSATPPPRPSARKRRSPEARAAAAALGRSRFAAQSGVVCGCLEEAGAAAVAAGSAVAGAPPGVPQLARKQLVFQTPASPVAAGRAGSGEGAQGSLEANSLAAEISQSSKLHKEADAAVPAAQESGSSGSATPVRLPSPPAGGSAYTRKPRKQRAPTAAASAEGTVPWQAFMEHIRQPASSRVPAPCSAAPEQQQQPMAAVRSAEMQLATPSGSNGDGTLGSAGSAAVTGADSTVAALAEAATCGSHCSSVQEHEGQQGLGREPGDPAAALMQMMDHGSCGNAHSLSLPPQAPLLPTAACHEGPSPVEGAIHLINSQSSQPMPPFVFGTPSGSSGSSYRQWAASAASPELARGQGEGGQVHQQHGMLTLMSSPSPPRPSLLLPPPAAAALQLGWPQHCGSMGGGYDVARLPRRATSICPLSHGSAWEGWERAEENERELLALDVGHGVVTVDKAALQRRQRARSSSTAYAAAELGRLSLQRPLQLLSGSFAASGLSGAAVGAR